MCVFMLQNRERSSFYGGNRPMREDSLARKYTLMKEATFFPPKPRNVSNRTTRRQIPEDGIRVCVCVCICVCVYIYIYIYIYVYILIYDYMKVHYTKSWALALRKKRGEKGIKKDSKKEKERQRLERRMKEGRVVGGVRRSKRSERRTKEESRERIIPLR